MTFGLIKKLCCVLVLLPILSLATGTYWTDEDGGKTHVITCDIKTDKTCLLNTCKAFCVQQVSKHAKATQKDESCNCANGKKSVSATVETGD